jgi:hypothetical protein
MLSHELGAEIEIMKRPDGSLWELGAGGFGRVFKAIRNGVQPVAVKVLVVSDGGHSSFLRPFAPFLTAECLGQALGPLLPLAYNLRPQLWSPRLGTGRVCFPPSAPACRPGRQKVAPSFHALCNWPRAALTLLARCACPSPWMQSSQEDCSRAGELEFQHEIALLRACRDTNIVQFQGVCFGRPEGAMLVTEYMVGVWGWRHSSSFT